MTADRTGVGKKAEMQSRLLPKNYRQIGDPGAKRIYVEDYVYTYLNKMAQPGNLYSRGAILFGNMYQTASGPCMFISGASSCQNIEFDLEETVFSEEVWDEIYRVRDTFFPDLEICGWFLSRMGFSVELNDKIIRMHMDNFSGDHKILYMMDVLENEDAFYQFENYSLKKQRGYYIYYEANHAMADYMLAEGVHESSQEIGRTSSEILRDTSVVKNYKKTLQQKKSGQQHKRFKWSPSAAAGAAVMAMALFYGAYSVYQFRQGEAMLPVFEQQESHAEDATWAEGREIPEGQETSENNTEETGREQSDSADDAADLFPDSSQTEEGSSMTEETAAFGQEKQQMQDTEIQDTEEQSGLSDTGGTGELTTDTEEDTDVFTQEEPEEAEESWSYIGGQYTVKQGDTLASISKEIYRSYDYIQKIADVNGIENVDQIFPGQVLKIPQIDD